VVHILETDVSHVIGDQFPNLGRYLAQHDAGQAFVDLLPVERDGLVGGAQELVVFVRLRDSTVSNMPAPTSNASDFVQKVVEPVSKIGSASKELIRSRLLTATNPESGTITYTYDADGEMLQKTSPAPNQINPAVTQTITYCYDALHRLAGKAYGALSCPLSSPVVHYTYDGGPNAKGKLPHLDDPAGTADYVEILVRFLDQTMRRLGRCYSIRMRKCLDEITEKCKIFSSILSCLPPARWSSNEMN
jgi:YD repeat-containing protein